MALTGRMVAVTLALSVLVSGCAAGGRTPKAFCDTLDKHRVQYETAMAEAQQAVSDGGIAGLFGGATKAVSAITDLQLMWEDLAEVAPDEIAGDVLTIRDDNAELLRKVKDNPTDLLGLAASGLARGMSGSASYERFHAYAIEHCGNSPFGGQ